MIALFQGCPSCGVLVYLTESDVQQRRVTGQYQQANTDSGRGGTLSSAV
jgi:hypothetical protein